MKQIISIMLILLSLVTLIPAIPSAYAEENLIVVNASDDVNGSAIITATEGIKETGGVIKLVGEFTTDSNISVYKGTTIDATDAVINSTAVYTFDAYKQDDVNIYGGVWHTKGKVIKFSGARNCSVIGITVNRGVTEFPEGEFEKTWFCKNAPVFAYNTDDLIIKDCDFSSLDSDAVYIAESCNNGGKIYVVDCKVNQCWGHGIHYYVTNSPVILGNTVTNVCGDGIYCSTSPDVVVSGNSIDGVTVNPFIDLDITRNNETRSGCGIFMSHTDRANLGASYTFDGKTYEGNTMTNVVYYGIPLNICDRTTIYKAYVENSGDNAIHSSASSRTTVTDCKVNKTGLYGVAFVPGKLEENPYDNKVNLDGVVVNCDISGCQRGVWAEYSKSITLLGNAFSNISDMVVLFSQVENGIISGNTFDPLVSEAAVKPKGVLINNSSINAKIGTEVLYNGVSYGKNILKDSDINVYSTSGYEIGNNEITSSEKAGITVGNCSGTGVISGNKIDSSGSNGIRAYNTADIQIKSNTISKSGLNGVQLDANENAVVEGNRISKTKVSGVRISVSSGVGVKLNTVEESGGHGVYISALSDNVVVEGNTLKNNTLTGVTVIGSRAPLVSSNNIDLTKTASGIVINGDEKAKVSSNVIKSTADKGIYVLNKSTGTLVDNNKISSAFSTGIYFNSSDKGIVSSNTLSSSKTGIIANNSSETEIKKNKVVSTSDKGIYLLNNSDKNVVEENTLSATGNTAVYVNKCNNSKLHQNSVTSTKGGNGIVVNGGLKSDITSNTIKNTADKGICVLNKSDNSYIFGNNIFSAKGVGVHIASGSGSARVKNNIITSPKDIGIAVSSSAGARLEENKVSSSSKTSVVVKNSSKTLVKSNSITKSSESGISVISNSTDTTIKDNKINQIKLYGIGISNSKKSSLLINQINNTQEMGIKIKDSDTITVDKNKVTKTESFGIGAYDSKGVKLKSNEVTNVSVTGVKLKNIRDARAECNTIKKTNGYGLAVYDSKDIKLLKNTMSQNQDAGVRLNNSSNLSGKFNVVERPVNGGFTVEYCKSTNMKNAAKSVISLVNSKSTKLYAYVTSGNGAKVKIGNKYYTCSVKNGVATLNKFPEQRKGTVIQFYEYLGNGNTVVKNIKVR